MGFDHCFSVSFSVGSSCQGLDQMLLQDTDGTLTGRDLNVSKDSEVGCGWKRWEVA